MKITTISLMFLVLCLPITPAQDSTHLNLPDGAVARIGKGTLAEIQYSPDGTRLAVASTVGIWLYDTTTNRAVTLLTGHTKKVLAVVFSPDGKTLASGSQYGAVRLWEVGTGKLKGMLPAYSELTRRIVSSPDGKTLANASGTSCGAVHLWDVETGEQKRVFSGHIGQINSMEFGPDGYLASTSDDGTVLRWKVD